MARFWLITAFVHFNLFIAQFFCAIAKQPHSTHLECLDLKRMRLDINGVWQRSSNIDALKDAVQAEVSKMQGRMEQRKFLISEWNMVLHGVVIEHFKPF